VASFKTEIIEALFNRRWDPTAMTLSDPVVTLLDVQEAIAEYNARLKPARPFSTRNPANFFKDYTRRTRLANEHWPASVLQRGFTARQLTSKGLCFEFVPLQPGQATPFAGIIAPPGAATARREIGTVGLPLASRRLGRGDEPWLLQVLVRLQVIETHLALFSTRTIVQVDHLQMSVKQTGTEIDALFLAVEQIGRNEFRELIVTCEAKGRTEDLTEEQIRRQAERVFRVPGVTQEIAIPMAVKAIGSSTVHVLEWEPVERAAGADFALTLASEAVYELKPAVPGIGR